jgi:hypothetical protein
MLGFGAMIAELGGNEQSVQAFTAAIGKEIAQIKMDENELVLKFVDSSAITFKDEAQSCCEHRYMNTDDRLNDYVGAKLLGAQTKSGPTEEREYGDPKDCEFLEVITSEGSFIIKNYNEHNGYYGGFEIRVSAGGSTDANS